MPSIARRALAAHTTAALELAAVFIRIGLAIADYATWVDRKGKYLIGSVRTLRNALLVQLGRAKPMLFPRCRRASNRTPEHIEREVARLHEAQRHLGHGQLALLLERVAGVRLARETVRAILRRRRDLILEMTAARKKPLKRIYVNGP
ncbi:MAG: hypothetical protein JST54_35545, partial [Deltaproteobacteria bacterium]|nr:hypothetical protein [Deltaproteobacteria bacterium]